jgi:hypothetical protein
MDAINGNGLDKRRCSLCVCTEPEKALSRRQGQGARRYTVPRNEYKARRYQLGCYNGTIECTQIGGRESLQLCAQ